MKTSICNKTGARINTVALLILVISLAACSIPLKSARADFSLTILHINDLHSRLQPVNAFNATCSEEEDARGECFGGIARLKWLIDQRRQAAAARGESVIVLDAGDQFQGSLFYTTYHGESAAEFMNGIGFDAMAVGNHEFDNGAANLARFIDKARFPVISSNIDATDSAELKGRLPAYTIIQRDTTRIGIVSAVAEDTFEISSPGPGVSFLPAVEAIDGAVAELGRMGVEIIVALTHIGIGRDRELARKIDGLDVVVGGHSHTLLSDLDPNASGPYPVLEAGPSGTQVPVVQAHAYSRNLGELNLVFDESGRVVSIKGRSIPLDSSVPSDPTFAKRVAILAKPFEALLTNVVTRSSGALTMDGCRRMECELGNLVTDAMLARVQSQGVLAAIQNGGGIRASLPAGDITMGDVLSVLPFQNTLSTFSLRGEHIIEALENGVSRVEENAGRFPQVAGLRYSWSQGDPPGHRIRTVEIREKDEWRPVDPARRYLLVSNDYLRRGGDGYTMLRDHAENVYDFGPALEDVVVDFLSANPGYRAEIGSRINPTR